MASAVDEVMRMIVNGVSVVTSRRGDEMNGLAAAWVCRVSHRPPVVMVSIAPPRHTHDMVRESGVFAVNILAEGQEELGRHFGLKSGRDTEKFESVPYETKVTGAPILKDCLAYMDCRVMSETPAGDHTVFLGEVVEHGVKSGAEPLVYRPKDYWG